MIVEAFAEPGPFLFSSISILYLASPVRDLLFIAYRHPLFFVLIR